MEGERAMELCKRYALEAQVANVSQSVLQRISCEFAQKTIYPRYDSHGSCYEPGEDGRLPCTLMDVEELAKEEDGGICDNCKKHRMPALKALQGAKKRMAQTRKEIVWEGMRYVVAERLMGINNADSIQI